MNENIGKNFPSMPQEGAKSFGATSKPKMKSASVKDTESMMAMADNAMGDAREFLGQQIKERPYVTLGVALGVGYILGGGLPRRLDSLLLPVIGRALYRTAMKKIQQKFLLGSNDK